MAKNHWQRKGEALEKSQSSPSRKGSNGLTEEQSQRLEKEDEDRMAYLNDACKKFKRQPPGTTWKKFNDKE